MRKFISNPQLENTALFLLDKEKLAFIAPISILQRVETLRLRIRTTRTEVKETIDESSIVCLCPDKRVILGATETTRRYANGAETDTHSSKFAKWFSKCPQRFSKHEIEKKLFKYGFDIVDVIV